MEVGVAGREPATALSNPRLERDRRLRRLGGDDLLNGFDLPFLGRCGDLQEGGLIVVQAGGPSGFLSGRRDGGDLGGAMSFCRLNAKLASGCPNPTPGATAGFCFNLKRNLCGLCGFCLRLLCERDPLGDLLRPFEFRQLGAVQVLGDRGQLGA
ncbi:hypothetical protein MKK68_00965 [Methylobacterium sp. E-016]|uniref:hypothetical protein n=1 Tax=Methylobacterium sp. E-016 TaxID=2836556 RepID=UPI001FBA7975|nr:hypothetical protein [Methylobacterium sp. E-016]MCJ2074233.1 hypothetical protein [Methylobacterium sp. E-016]